MSMMRRGPLDRYPVEWVLRQASTHRASGTIELHGPQPVAVHLENGRVAHAERGIPGLDGSEPPLELPATDEAGARRNIVDILAGALAAEGGWYYHDPLTVVPPCGPWRWDVASLLMDARSCAHEHRVLGPWADRSVDLCSPPGSAGVTLGADPWAVVTALAIGAPATELRSRLDWSADRLLAALAELGRQGAVVADDSPRPAEALLAPPPPPTYAARPAAPAPADAAAAVQAAEEVLARAGTTTSAVRWPGQVDGVPPRPTVDAPQPEPAATVASARALPSTDAADDRRSALRRLIHSLRPA